jgi:hypothetical protein
MMQNRKCFRLMERWTERLTDGDHSYNSLPALQNGINFKTFELSISYRGDIKHRSFNTGHLSVTLTLRVVT